MPARNRAPPDFGEFRAALIGQPISQVWRGCGSALFIELGALTAALKPRRDGSPANPIGETSIMIEWSWRIERPRSILGGSWSATRRWPSMFAKLTGARVLDAGIVGVLPELTLSLSNGLRISSFMTAEGQPAWAIISHQLGKSLHVKAGRLHAASLAAQPTYGICVDSRSVAD